MAAVTIERIAVVHAHITDAVVKTSERSTLSAQDMDGVIAQSCAEACDLLADWLEDQSWWDRMRPMGDGTVAGAIPDQENFVKFLDPMFRDALSKIARHGISVSASYVDEARERLADTARRHRRMKRGDLLREARSRVEMLRSAVCQSAAELKRSSAWRRRARGLLKRVTQLLVTVALPIALAMTAAAPHDMARNVSVWAHDAVSVIVTHNVAHQAQPSLQIAPPRPGFQLH